MKANSIPNVPCKESSKEDCPKNRLGKLKRSLRNFKNRMRKPKEKTLVKSSGLLKGQWSQYDLPKIVKKIVDNNPGLTSLEIYANQIHWHCEINYFDLFPRKKENQNPSKREDDKRI